MKYDEKDVSNLVETIKYILSIIFSTIIFFIDIGVVVLLIGVVVLLILFFADLILYVYDNFTSLSFLK